MKYLFWLLGLIFFLTPQTVFAHSPGQPSFFKVNNIYTDFYHVQSNSYIADFAMPQDSSPANYLVNEPINFEIDLTRIQIPEDALQKTKFLWDFADGTQTKGLTATHTYTKPGSYIVVINADSTAFDKDIPVMMIQSTMVHVLPSKDYKLPQAIIMVNGKTVKKPAKDILPINTTKQTAFDASLSKAGSSDIAMYHWDFDDGVDSKEKIVLHKYENKRAFIAPILRVTDKNGLISDGYIVLKADPKNGTVPPEPQKKSPSLILWASVAIGVVLMILFGIVLKRKKK